MITYQCYYDGKGNVVGIRIMVDGGKEGSFSRGSIVVTPPTVTIYTGGQDQYLPIHAALGVLRVELASK